MDSGKAKHEADQTSALRALIKHLGPKRPLRELVNMLTQKVLAREGGKAFSKDDVDRAIITTVNESETSTILAAKSFLTDVEESAERSCLKNQTDKKGNMPASTDLIIQVLQELGEQSGLRFSDIAGQVLRQNRNSRALRTAKHREVVDDVSWIEEPAESIVNESSGLVECVKQVFRLSTTSDSGCMRWNTWQRIADLICKNPILNARVRHTDIDRLFYQAANRDPENSKTISRNEFLGLLLDLAEASSTHPSIIFFAVGCHAERLASEQARPAQIDAEAADGEDLAEPTVNSGISS